MTASRPEPFEAILREVRSAVPPGYARADWQVAVDTLLELHAGRLVERTPIKSARRLLPPQHPEPR